MDPVYLVIVEGRMDGTYVFADRDDAQRFAAAVGPHAQITEEPVLASDDTDVLIDAERED